MTVVIAVDKGILPRICSDEIKGDGIVNDVFAEEYLVPSKKQYILRFQKFHGHVFFKKLRLLLYCFRFFSYLVISS